MTAESIGTRAEFASSLAQAGYLSDPNLIDAFSNVPRSRFVPAFFQFTPEGQWRPVVSGDAGYLDLIYADTTLTTQVNGAIEPVAGAYSVDGTGTSSSTQPGLMAAMLEALSLEGRQRVLELGTGTGYNAALLSHVLGSEYVTSVEFDPRVADLARERIAESGFEPTLITGDGTAGWPGNAPYDRVIATVAFPQIPRAWIEQCADGAVIVASLWRDLGGGPLVRLNVAGGEASGRFLTQFGGFMPTRSVTAATTELSAAAKQTGVKRDIQFASGILRRDHADLWIALIVDHVTWLGFTPTGGHEQLWLFAPDGSWAAVEDATMTVEQYGPRQLWDEVEGATRRWELAGEPNRDRMGLTVRKDGLHRFWLDDADHIMWEDAPA